MFELWKKVSSLLRITTTKTNKITEEKLYLLYGWENIVNILNFYKNIQIKWSLKNHCCSKWDMPLSSDISLHQI